MGFFCLKKTNDENEFTSSDVPIFRKLGAGEFLGILREQPSLF
jgi:hypothetical protein